MVASWIIINIFSKQMTKIYLDVFIDYIRVLIIIRFVNIDRLDKHSYILDTRVCTYQMKKIDKRRKNEGTIENRKSKNQKEKEWNHHLKVISLKFNKCA